MVAWVSNDFRVDYINFLCISWDFLYIQSIRDKSNRIIYNKQPTFKLNHKTLKLFGLNRKTIQPYLAYFEEAGLIEYSIKKGYLPIIHLHHLPINYYIINNDNKQQYIIKGTGVPRRTGKSRRRTGNVSAEGQVITKYQEPSEGTHQAREGTKQGRVVA